MRRSPRYPRAPTQVGAGGAPHRPDPGPAAPPPGGRAAPDPHTPRLTELMLKSGTRSGGIAVRGK
ncbi:hypothetical protein SAMN05216268_10726 [Streptomyces yunnanensis]|uniref:Uncharacterized protein n=1 Tax=Streptomyces yunnanensis TaxID=156453 RepID=A0A9X8MUQ6_9ACTN|nr:hypothetical protein SAMN05216268_10726 [Streptomyces yunnanensis]